LDAKLRVTTESDESAFMDLVDGKNVINIPLFQRAFKWTKKNLQDFWSDVETILSADEELDSQFLGVIVFVAQDQKPSRPNLFDAVDGQQRLTTCYLNVMALAHAAAENQREDYALDIAKTYLLTRPFSSISTNTKLIPSAVDRQQFATIWAQFASLPTIGEDKWGEYKPAPPSPAGDPEGNMLRAYSQMLRHARDLYRKGGHELAEEFLTVILSKLSFVQINLADPIKAPQIFERLNARGQKIDTADLVRNEIFSRVAEDTSNAKAIFDSEWEPFARRYRDSGISLEQLLFPYGLMKNSLIKKDNLFHHLRKTWTDVSDPRLIIRDLDQFTPCVFAVETGDVKHIPGKALKAAFGRLHRIRAPSSMYPFLFALVKNVKENHITEAAAVDIIFVLETFLFRRGVCGHEPTGLHAVFKGLWGELEKVGHTAETVRQGISKRTTVPWPGNQQFQEAIRQGKFYGKSVARYGIMEFELSRVGESPADDFEIEHVYPQTPDAGWNETIVAGEEAAKLRETWGNLAPITKRMNPSLGNVTYALKVIDYEGAVFSSLREIAALWPDGWSLESIKSRNDMIATWALTRWPHQKAVIAMAKQGAQ
jgi:hypothetical protein